MYGRAVCQDLSDGSSVFKSWIHFNDHFITDFYFTTIINQQNTTHLAFHFINVPVPKALWVNLCLNVI